MNTTTNSNTGGVSASSIKIPARPEKGGEGGEGGDTTPPSPPLPPPSGDGNWPESNGEFLVALFPSVREGERPVVCSKWGDPTAVKSWTAVDAEKIGQTCPPTANNYFNCSTFRPEPDGSVRATKASLAQYHVLMLDDVGTKVPLDAIGDITPTYIVETSPRNFQYGIRLAVPLGDEDSVTAFQKSVGAAGLSDKGAMGLARWARLPFAVNGKEKYLDDNGQPFSCRLTHWSPDTCYTIDELYARLSLSAATAAQKNRGQARRIDAARPADISHEVFQPRKPENPVVTALKERGLYKGQLSPGKHDVTCLWVDEHTDQLDDGAAYIEPSDAYPLGGFKCHHSHGDDYHIAKVLDELKITTEQARNRPTIKLIPGAIDQVIWGAEFGISQFPNVYQAGGLIVHIKRDALTKDPSIEAANEQSLLTNLASSIDWLRWDGRQNKQVRCDPPERVVKGLLRASTYRYLKVLKGIARQPFYREGDGYLVTASGYDEASGIYASFCAPDFSIPEKTREAADKALATILTLVEEFKFVSEHDKAAAIAAMFTAALRPSIPLAPAFLITAPDSGTGKSYLNSVIAAFAGDGEPQRTSFPKTSEEATKSTQSHLLASPAVIEFDDMDCDFLPHGALNRLLTCPTLTDRILGVSRIATVSTRTLVLGSGINVEPVRDMRRRVITVRLAPRQQGGITRAFKGRPAKEVRANRGKYITAVLTIVEAYRAAGSPTDGTPSIATYGDEWSDFCRRTLIWLGLPDPATALIEQVEFDPENEQFGLVLREWHAMYGSTPVTVRKIMDENRYQGDHPLYEALMDLPIVERGSINPSRFGWYLKKKANKVIDGYTVRESEADGRKGWKVVKVVPITPPSPPLSSSD